VEAGTTVDRAVGALLGLACGDAVGTTLEFARPGSFEPITDMVGGGPFGLRPGQWTDDTSMALCLAESIVDRGGLDLDDQLRRYVLWWRQGYLSSTGRCFDIGGTTRSQLGRFERTGVAVDPRVDEEAAANGSLMRLAAVPVRWHGDVAEAAAMSGESSRTTHAAARPVDACRAMGAMVAALIGGQPWDEVTSAGFWRWGALHPAVEAVVRGSWRGKQPPAIRGTGYCVDALEAALWAVGGASSFADAVLRAANLGDDADTTAAIAGQLAGARWGRSGIPAGWRARVVLADRVEALALRLAGDALDPWPFDPNVHAWWVEPGAVLAGEYPGRRTEKVDLLVDAGVRTFVDLTVEGELDPYEGAVAAASSARGLDLRHERHPVPDLGVVGAEGYRAILDAIAAGRERGIVYLHCWGGVGRTGTVVGCLLREQGVAAADVVVRLAELRAGTRKSDRGCPETAAQRAVVESWGT
jgi:ADP-ribosylglycohydrolase